MAYSKGSALGRGLLCETMGFEKGGFAKLEQRRIWKIILNKTIDLHSKSYGGKK